ncbi:MAG: methyl-accepting chemotaxis protein [Planctomycetota bacterium]
MSPITQLNSNATRLQIPRGTAFWRRQMAQLGLDESSWQALHEMDAWLRASFRDAAAWFPEAVTRSGEGAFPAWEITRRDSRFRELLVQYLEGMLAAEDTESYLHQRLRIAETHLSQGVPAAWWMHGHRLVLGFLTERLMRRRFVRRRRLSRQLVALEKLFGFDEQLWRELHSPGQEIRAQETPDFLRIHGLQDHAFQTGRQVTAIRDCHGQVVQLRSAMTQGSSRLDEVGDVLRLANDELQGTRTMVQQDIDELEVLRRHIGTLAEQVRSLEEQSHEIEEVITTAKTLSYRSKVVSINATIEAARAGEAGRGFEVVSHEMGRLARKSHEATLQIEEILGQLLQSTGLAAEAVYSGERVTERVAGLAQSLSASLGSLHDRCRKAREILSLATGQGDRLAELAEQLEGSLEDVEQAAKSSLNALESMTED